MASVKGNIVLNGINTVTSLLFPVVTFPYAARILLPDGIGAINFLNSIIGYIILLTSLGIPMYAVKEIARHRNDRIERDKVAIEITILSIILCVLGYILVWILATHIPRIHEQARLFYILSLSILFTSIGVNWFYQGIEDFKFITIRAVIIRFLSACALFIFVKSPSDLLIYGIITVASTVGNNLINFVHLRKHISIRNISLSSLNVNRHIKPAIQVFILNLIISMYLQLNSVMLGFMSGDEAVGYYTAGSKITYIGISVISSIGTVLLPRCSHLIKSGKYDEFAVIINKSLKLTLALSLPLAAGLIILSRPLTITFCGESFLPSIPILYITAPIVIFVTLTNVMGIQILYPMDKINIVVTSVGAAAILNIILNLVLIPQYKAIGAAFATLISEFSVFLIQLVLGKKFYPFKLSAFFDYKYITATLIMGIAVYLLSIVTIGNLLKIIIAFTCGITIYITVLVTMHEELILQVKDLLLSRFRHT